MPPRATRATAAAATSARTTTWATTSSRCFLDPTMMYSSAVFERPDMSTRSRRRSPSCDRICREARPATRRPCARDRHRLGRLRAARRAPLRLPRDHDHDLARAACTGRASASTPRALRDRITLLADDYRDLTGRYDKLVSIEMIEAVGHQYFDTFFRTCSERLKPGGTMLLQAITIADQQYEAARDSVDFIKRHIFPGCCIPSIARAQRIGGPRVAAAHHRPRRHRAALRAPRWHGGAPTCCATPTVRARSATPTRSCACGSSTSVIAKAALPKVPSATRRSC